MGVAGLIFEPHPPNFANQYNFWRCSKDVQMIFLISLLVSYFQRSVWECSLHICSCPCFKHTYKHEFSKITIRKSLSWHKYSQKIPVLIGVKRERMVFCYQNCSDLLWEKNILVIEKNFWNSRTIYSNCESSQQFLLTECFFNLFLKVSHI